MKPSRLLFVALAACTSTPAQPTTLAVTPATANVLTCSTQQFTANELVTWSATPGAIDDTGLYTSPLTQAAASATITATSATDTATADVALATAFPGAPVAVPTSATTTTTAGTIGIYQHAISGRGARAYAAWQDNPPASTHVSLQIARTDDRGATWSAAHIAAAADLTDGGDTTTEWIECAAVAIDAGNPDVVYATARISGANSLGVGVGDDLDSTLVFAMSQDGGATFTHAVLRTGIIGFCPDVISPAPNVVVVEDPVDTCGKDMWVWTDANRGAAFATGAFAQGSAPGGEVYYVADGTSIGLDESDGRDCGATDKVNLESDGTTDAGGEATEAPRLFTDGAGHTCISYIGDTTGATGDPVHAYAQCSTDDGKTFGPLVTLDPGTGNTAIHSQAVGAIGPHGAIAVAFVRVDASSLPHLFLALSSDGGATFAAPIPVPTYRIPGATAALAVNPSPLYDADGVLWLAYRPVDGDGGAERVVVDKTCDAGASWSGPVLVNGSEGAVIALKWPLLVAGDAPAPLLAATGATGATVIPLAP